MEVFLAMCLNEPDCKHSEIRRARIQTRGDPIGKPNLFSSKEKRKWLVLDNLIDKGNFSSNY